MGYNKTGPIGKSRSLLTASTNGIPIMAQILQAGVNNELYDWIAADGYARTVVPVQGLLAWFRMNDANQAAGLLDSYGNAIGSPQNGAYSSAGVTYGVTGLVGEGTNKAVSFNGTTGTASVALNLAGATTLTIEFWLNWTTFSNLNNIALEYSALYSATNGTFVIIPNSSTYTGVMEFTIHGSVGTSSWTCVRPTAGAMHHYVVQFTFGTSDSCIVYIDGVAVTLTSRVLVANAGQTFANSTLYIMSRNLNSLFGAGIMDELALYTVGLTPTQVTSHYIARI